MMDPRHSPYHSQAAHDKAQTSFASLSGQEYGKEKIARVRKRKGKRPDHEDQDDELLRGARASQQGPQAQNEGKEHGHDEKDLWDQPTTEQDAGSPSPRSRTGRSKHAPSKPPPPP